MARRLLGPHDTLPCVLIILLFGGKGQTAKLIKPKQSQIISAVQSSLKMYLKCSVQLVAIAVNSIPGWFLESNLSCR